MTREEYWDKIAEIVKEISKGREIVFYGYNKFSLDGLRERKLEIKKVFTANAGLLQRNDENFEDYRLLKNIVGKVFVILPNDSLCGGGVKRLNGWGYTEEDYYPMSPSDRVRLFSPKKNYSDEYGNEINCGGVKNINISFHGHSNKVIVGKTVQINKGLNIIISSSNNTIIIGDRCRFTGDSSRMQILGEGCTEYYIGEDCRFTAFGADAVTGTELLIGNKTTFENGCRINLSAYTAVSLGEDCMISTEVIFQANDGHTIFDTETGSNLNSDMRKLKDNDGFLKVTDIGDHVWVGRRTTVLGPTSIGSGSIVGTMSLVKGRFPNNVIIAGIPGKVIKKNRSWARNNAAADIVPDTGVHRLTEND